MKYDIVTDLIKKDTYLLEPIKKYDITTYKHMIHTGFLMEDMLNIGVCKDYRIAENLIEGALLHDVGKIDIPKHILCAPRVLTENEMWFIKSHPIMGLKHLDQDLPMEVFHMCAFHHEYINGKGYYYGYRGDMIPSYCRLMTLIDIIEAVSSLRPYHIPVREYASIKQLICDTGLKGMTDKHIGGLLSDKLEKTCLFDSPENDFI